MQIPFLSGRAFNPSDYVIAASNSGMESSGAPTPVIVNQSFIAKYLGKDEPIGKVFGQTAGDPDSPKNSGWQIVGVVRDAKYSKPAPGHEPDHVHAAERHGARRSKFAPPPIHRPCCPRFATPSRK